MRERIVLTLESPDGKETRFVMYVPMKRCAEIAALVNCVVTKIEHEPKVVAFRKGA
jgi:hypothetical protein